MDLANNYNRSNPLHVQSVIGHTGHSILVMDDERLILNLASNMLEYLGYSTTTCTKGEEAIELYRSAKESNSPYLAVIMDLTVFGGMSGKDAAQQLIQIDPFVRLIVSSGYSDDPVMANYKDFGFCLSLPKPYTLSDLTMILASLHSMLPAYATPPA
jgi:two-component system, cell cycle sensor histidine kinase and response regulator CckA